MSHRIAYVAKVFPRTSETFVINEVRALEALGEHPVVFSLHRNPAPVTHAILRDLAAPVEIVEETVVDDAEVRKATERLARLLDIAEAERPALLPRKYVRLGLALTSLAGRHGVGHLHAHFASRAGHVALLAAQLGGIGFSMTAHAKDIYHRDVDRDVLAWKIRRARFVVTVTDYNRRHLLELMACEETEAAGIVRLYNGVDLERFSPNQPPPAEVPRKLPRIVSIGRLVEKKGFDVLIEACAMLRDRGLAFHCDIVGGGDLESSLRDLVARRGLGDVVTLCGSVSTEQVTERLRQASLVALPCVVGSDGNVDALPTALLEGMACGLPLVSTRLSGIPEIVVDGENGLLVEPGDIGGLAGAIAQILADPARAEAMGRAGRRRAEAHFDLRRNVAELAAMFRRHLPTERATA